MNFIKIMLKNDLCDIVLMVFGDLVYIDGSKCIVNIIIDIRI